MTQGFKDEFETIEILVNSDTKTGRTDAFIIAFTKLEKQVRRIFTYMAYQFPLLNLSLSRNILNIIASKRFLYFENFIKGFDAIYPKSFEIIVDSAFYTSFLKEDFPRISKLRNKILHGQPTGKNLSAIELKQEIDIIQKWCLKVAESMVIEIGYDGLEWNSFRKHPDKDFALKYKKSISDLKELDTFIDTHMK